MTEPKRGPGRPKFTDEQRNAASERSFLNSLRPVPGGTCEISTLTRVTDWDGNRVRPRKFAINYYFPDLDMTEFRVVMRCKTKDCVAREHITTIQLESSSPIPVNEGPSGPLMIDGVRIPKDVDAVVLTDDKILATYTKRLGKSGLPEEDRQIAVQQLKDWAQRNPIDVNGDDEAVYERIDLMEKCLGKLPAEDVDRLAPEWGLTA